MPLTDWSTVASENKSITNNEDLSTNLVEQNPRPYVHTQAIQAIMAAIAGLQLDDSYHHGLMNWMGEWVQQDYRKNDVVRDGEWLMIANKDTNQRAGIFPSGEPFYVYDGTIGTTNTSAKLLYFGNRYTMGAGAVGFLNGYRVYTVTGNVYSIYIVNNPTTVPVITPLITHTANTTGWRDFQIARALITEGDTFDLIVSVQEPDPTPTTWTGDWNYTKPNNEGIPALGQAQHSNRLPSSLRIHKTDDNGGDRSAELLSLNVGDIIELNVTRWSIQAITDQTTYVDFSVAPTLQDPSLGTGTFTFETVVATPITYAVDTGYWPTTPYNAQGLLGVDIPYEQIVPDTNAYGVDINVQPANVPTDWDFMSN